MSAADYVVEKDADDGQTVISHPWILNKTDIALLAGRNKNDAYCQKDPAHNV